MRLEDAVLVLDEEESECVERPCCPEPCEACGPWVEVGLEVFGILAADRHQAGHFRLGDVEFLAAEFGQRDVGDLVVALGREGLLDGSVHGVAPIWRAGPRGTGGGSEGGGQREDARGEWGRLMDRVRRHDGTVIVSHEILAGARPAQVRKAMAALEGSEVHLVYSARDLARQIPAEWQEGIKHRRRRSFARFLTQVQNARRSNPTMWFWRAQGLPDVLTRWGDGLPPDRIHLVTVPQAVSAQTVAPVAAPAAPA